jgi:tetratricopeptide (TPR) repeat protein
MERPRTRGLFRLSLCLAIGLLSLRTAAADPIRPDPEQVERFLELLREVSPLPGDLRTHAFRSSAPRTELEGADRLDRLLGEPRTLYLGGKDGARLEVAGPNGTVVLPVPVPPSPDVKEDWDAVIRALSSASDGKVSATADAALDRIRENEAAAGDARTVVLAGLVRYARGDAGAVESFESARRAAKGDVPSRLLAGFLHLSSGAPQKALEPLAEAARLAPRNPMIRELLAEANLRVGLIPRAIRLLEPLVEADPGAARPRLLLVRGLLLARRPREALDHLAKITGEASALEADCLAAHAHLLLGKPEAARVRALAAVERKPRALFPNVLLATALLGAGRIEEAMERTRDLVGAHPNAPAAWRLRAAAAEKRGESAVAEAAAARWRSLAPESIDAALALARIRTAAGRPDAAVPVLEGVLARQPRAAAAHRLLGAAHLAAGRRAEARESFEAFLRLVPKGPAAEAVRKRLAELQSPPKENPRQE